MTHPTPPFLSGAKPGIGHALEFQKDRTRLMLRGFAEHGNVFAIKLGNQNVAIVIGPENQKTFFLETDKKLNIQEPYHFLRAMFGEVLFLAPHEEYLRQRPFVQELFKREKMLQYIDVMQEVIQAWMDSLGNNGEMELNEQIVYLVQEVAGNCFLGRDAHRQIGTEFWNLYQDLSEGLDPLLPPNLPLPRFIRRDRARARMSDILRPIITERRQHPEKYADFLQDLVMKEDHHGVPIEDELIRNLLLGLMFAGHETTSGQAAWSIIFLLQYPDYLQRVLAELATVAPRGTHITPQAMVKLEHIGWLTQEVERLRPSVDLLLRVVKEDTQFGDYVVPAGWLVQVAQDVAHRLPLYFDQPEQFDPLRFAPDRAEDKQHRFALIGFGGGAHKCPGMNFANTEITLITAMLFREFELELVTKEPYVVHGLGASRPSETVVRYRRKPA